MKALILTALWMLVICYLNYISLWNIMVLWNVKYRKIENEEKNTLFDLKLFYPFKFIFSPGIDSEQCVY